MKSTIDFFEFHNIEHICIYFETLSGPIRIWLSKLEWILKSIWIRSCRCNPPFGNRACQHGARQRQHAFPAPARASS
jgi:hypothetical protein